MTKNVITVTRTLSLQPLQAEVIKLFNQSPSKCVNTLEFRSAGVASPAQCISQLKSKGAIIEKITKPATDDAGKVHDRIAHYILKGWK